MAAGVAARGAAHERVVSESRDWLRAVASAHAAGAGTWTDGRVTVRRVTGGANNPSSRKIPSFGKVNWG